MLQNKEFAERHAADLKLKLSRSQWICKPTDMQRGGKWKRGLCGLVKCTKCSKVMKHDIHSFGTAHLLFDYNSLERAHFSPNKHGLCRGGGNQKAWHASTPLADADGPRICTAITVADADRPRTPSCGRGLSADVKFVDPQCLCPRISWVVFPSYGYAPESALAHLGGEDCRMCLFCVWVM